jgi:hypothetical protein
MKERRLARTAVAALSGALTLSWGCSLLLDTQSPSTAGPCKSSGDCANAQECVAYTCRDTCSSTLPCTGGTICTLVDGKAVSTCLPLAATFDAESPADAVSNACDGTPSGEDIDAASHGGAETQSEAGEGGGCPYGPTTSGIVLFGGKDDIAFENDTWLWNATGWVEEKPAQSPPSRGLASLATMCGGVVLFGGSGQSAGGYMNDQWRWSDAGWTQQTPSPIPAPREGASFASLNGTAVLFGGAQPHASPYGDTWVWNGTVWSQALPGAQVPPPRRSAAMATLAGSVVLFGGDDGTGTALGDTWTWDGTAWANANPVLSPPARYWAAAATLDDRVVLFGGFDGSSSLDDTWTWDGATWTEEKPVSPPTKRDSFAMATFNDRVVLFGGEDNNQNVLGDTLIWDGTNWNQLAVNGPSARMYSTMASF